MAQFLQTNFATIVALIIAFVPFFVTMLKLLGDRPQKLKAPLDSQIKVRKIEYTPVDAGTWEALSLIELRRVILAVVSALVIITLLIILHDPIGLVITILLIILTIVVVSRVVVNFLTSPYKYRCRDCDAAKYYVFQDASIIVEGKIDYLFVKAQEAILSEQIKSIAAESDAQPPTISTFHYGDSTTPPGTISIKFPKEGTKNNQYAIEIDFTPAPHNLTALLAQVIPSRVVLDLKDSVAHLFQKPQPKISDSEPHTLPPQPDTLSQLDSSDIQTEDTQRDTPASQADAQVPQPEAAATQSTKISLLPSLAWIFPPVIDDPKKDPQVIEAKSRIIIHFLTKFLTAPAVKS